MTSDTPEYGLGAAQGSTKSVNGTPVYTTAQFLAQHAVYAVSDHIFSYVPESLYLDQAVNSWSQASETNGQGRVPTVGRFDARTGAGAAVVGFLKANADKSSSTSADLTANTILASAGTLRLLQPVLSSLVALDSSSVSGLVVSASAADVSASTGTLVNDYYAAIDVARTAGLMLVTSLNVGEVQATALLASVLSRATHVPTVHLYEGVRGASESVKSATTTAEALAHGYSSVLKTLGQKSTVLEALEAFNAVARTSFQPFEYFGPTAPATVMVVFGAVETAVARRVVSEKVGVVSVRLYRPFLKDQFLQAVPESTKSIVVLGQVGTETQVADSTTHSDLYTEVATAVYMNGVFTGIRSPLVVEEKYSVQQVPTATQLAQLVDSTVAAPVDRQYVFWETRKSAAAMHESERTLAHALSLDDKANVSFVEAHTSLELAGVTETQVRVAPVNVVPVAGPTVDSASAVFVNDLDLLSVYDVTAAAAPGATVLLAATPENLEKAAGFARFKRAAALKSLQVYTLDYSQLQDLAAETQGRTASMALQISFWRLAEPTFTIDQITTKIVLSNGVDTELVAATVVRLAEAVFERALVRVDLAEEGSEMDVDSEVLQSSVAPDEFVLHDYGFSPEDDSVPTYDQVPVRSIAQQYVFSEAYGSSNELRPDLPVKTFVAKVQVNRRVTPEDYDRHIFHMELDITGTGLVYNIGEALGVHAPNSTELVNEFLDWYNLDGSAVVTVAARDRPGFVESQTVFQLCRDGLDLFGKPPKKFYEGLAAFATEPKQKAHLTKLASPAGAPELKRRGDIEFLNYVDILAEFDSARPTIEELAGLVSPLKRREYSISSSQHVHPNSVHLLIVVVEWDSNGRKRYGQCSKYLADLGLGAEVVVSVKPSVMKLPPLTTQPIIMAGLGTGLAPFKAFLEERAWQKEQGHEIGDIYLFLGSRYQAQEYLYGELFEAYRDAGVLTYIGAAFSRDQPQKIYIQDRIREAKDRLVNAFVVKNGSFYLCGPTWPVPDISEALADIIAIDAATRGKTIDRAREIEELKEAGRYILEVY